MARSQLFLRPDGVKQVVDAVVVVVFSLGTAETAAASFANPGSAIASEEVTGGLGRGALGALGALGLLGAVGMFEFIRLLAGLPWSRGKAWLCKV